MQLSLCVCASCTVAWAPRLPPAGWDALWLRGLRCCAAPWRRCVPHAVVVQELMQEVAGMYETVSADHIAIGAPEECECQPGSACAVRHAHVTCDM